MEDQIESSTRTRLAPEKSEGMENVSANASASAADQSTGNTDAAVLTRRGESGNQGPVETVIFKTQYGVYIWPFELCRSHEMIKPLVEEIYALRNDERHISQVRRGEYDILNEVGAVILPTVWSTIVQPSTTIEISFWSESPRFPEPSSNTEGRRWTKDEMDEMGEDVNIVRDDDTRARSSEYLKEVDVAVDDSVTPLRHLASTRLEGGVAQSERTDSDLDSDSTDSTETEDEVLIVAEDPVPVREVIPPTDADGNKLSFCVDTSWPGHGPLVRKELENKVDGPKVSTRSKGTQEGHIETLRITKAVSVETDAKTVIQVHTLPGLIPSQLSAGVKMTWCHIQADRLDFSRFKEVCLGIPNLSSRLQILTRELLAKIEKHKVKVFLNGLFIEPGIVLRADEKCRPDPGAVIFSCVPYYDLQPLTKKLSTAGSGDRLFPPRTLMQSFYPFEPVQERDSEQAYKRFGSDQSNNLVYVPNLWVMNIGVDIVVTCGHKPLTEEMIKSISVVQEDLRQLGMTDITKDTLTNIRLTDWNNHVHLYQLDACRSYFQMEQKLRDLRVQRANRTRSKSLRMTWGASEEKTIITPKEWKSIIRRTDLVFIELVSLDDKSAEIFQMKPTTEDLDLTTSVDLAPPFFHWPSAMEKDDIQQERVRQGSLPSDMDGSKCLELAEKAMLNATLDEYDTTNAVDKSFASTTFYQALSEETGDHVNAQFVSLDFDKENSNNHSHHATVVVGQCTSIVAKSARLCKLVHATLRLFVRDVDQSIVLRKVWGAMSNMHKIVARVQKRSATELDSATLPKPLAERSRRSDNYWYIRDGKERQLALPDADKRFKRSIRHCRRCTSLRPFENADAAVNHLRMHSKSQATTTRIEGSSVENRTAPSLEGTTDLNLDDWIINATQLKREESNADVLKIITQACEDASQLFEQMEELAYGVCNEDGKKSELYTFPRQLIEAFRKLVVFYLAIERALHHTEEFYQKTPNEADDQFDFSYSESVLTVLKRFAKGAQLSIDIAREELCNMVRPDASPDDMQGLSLGPEYVCSWLMRRLLVKPLEKRMTIGDMYREYLSTIQFQVNHRPGKRLIRSINLLQEELQVLIEVNKWQTKLIDNYTRVLDDTTYDKDIPSRRAMFPYERMLLESCRDNLSLSREDYEELFSRCGPLSDRTKQSLEINEEDHGKAIMVFTIVTIIFLPLSFVTSYLGMNTADIRDMTSNQSLFWIIAVPLALVTMGSTMFIGYNGDELRDAIVSVYRTATGKQDGSTSARGISVAQRKRVRQLQSDSNSTLNDTSLADEAEYADPRPEYLGDDYGWTTYQGQYNTLETGPTSPILKADFGVPQPRTNFRTQSVYYGKSAATPAPRLTRPPPLRQYGESRHDSRPLRYKDDRNELEDEWYVPVSTAMPKVATYSTVHEIAQHDEENAESVQDYTWHKKHKRRPVGGGRRPRYDIRDGQDLRANVQRTQRGPGEVRWRDREIDRRDYY